MPTILTLGPGHDRGAGGRDRRSLCRSGRGGELGSASSLIRVTLQAFARYLDREEHQGPSPVDRRLDSAASTTSADPCSPARVDDGAGQADSSLVRRKLPLSSAHPPISHNVD